MQSTDVVILGAGAAGLMAAIESGRRGRRTIILDHAEKAGKKILISGGGRCNFTNLNCRPENFLSANPHFAKSALARFTPADMIAMVERHKVPHHEKTLGQLFCDRSSHDIVTMLERECAEANVVLRTNTQVLSVDLEPDTGFRIKLKNSADLLAESVIVATGGLSIPKMGATSFGYDLAQRFGHRILACRPGLVPLTFNPEDRDLWCDLSGLSTEVVATTTTKSRTKAAFREKLLITHRGMSGPATLQISSYWAPGEPIELDLAPGMNVLDPLRSPNARRDPAALAQALRTIFPARLADRWTQINRPDDWTNPGLAALEQKLHSWRITPAGTEGYAKAEVTVGGVDTDQLHARTLESRLVPNLYFVGEVVDVTGWLGGYNFQWAWASGVSAGQSA